MTCARVGDENSVLASACLQIYHFKKVRIPTEERALPALAR